MQINAIPEIFKKRIEIAELLEKVKADFCER